MKSLLIALVFCLTICCSDYVLAQSVPGEEGAISFSWTANTESDLKGYRLHIGTISGGYDTVHDVKNVTTYTVRDLIVGVEYFTVLTAYDSWGNESGYSVEVVAKAKDILFPGIPVDFKEVTTVVSP